MQSSAKQVPQEIIFLNSKSSFNFIVTLYLVCFLSVLTVLRFLIDVFLLCGCVGGGAAREAHSVGLSASVVCLCLEAEQLGTDWKCILRVDTSPRWGCPQLRG